jgi:diguanylate cyclase (GGDEF)-like protein
MKLRTRIAVTFLMLLAAILAVALTAVSSANHGNAAAELKRQLDVGESVFNRVLKTNLAQLTLAAEVVAADTGFRAAVADRDNVTLISVLENSGARIKAAMVVLTSLDGEVIAASGSHAAAGEPFPERRLFVRRLGPDGETLPNTTFMVENGHIYQVVAVVVNSPLPVAWVVMGFELDRKAALELRDITGLGVTLSAGSSAGSRTIVSTAPSGQLPDSTLETRRIVLAETAGATIVATLSKSLAEAMTAFDRLTNFLYWIAASSLAVSAYAAFWLARNITRPLRAITSVVDRIRAGSYDVPIAEQRQDELGALAEGLRVMQAAVQSRDSSIRRLAYEDTLTGLMNRTAFNAQLDAALAHPDAAIAVAVINLHRFRRINEHLGYAVGDAVLKTIAARLTQDGHAVGKVARLAADQFAAFAAMRPSDSLETWGATLMVRLAEPVVVESQPIDISASAGLALAPADARTADELLRCADLAQERARRHKSGIARYEPKMMPAGRDQLSLLGELRHAVDHDELRLYFQPKIELSSHRVAGAEALLRWQHPTRGLLGPAAFIPFAEQAGFIRQITRWALEQSIACAAEWYRGGRALAVSVNVTVDDISDARFHLRVANALVRHQLPPGLLTLEVTESGFIEEPERALAMLDALAALGIKLAIDDFGTGYSSLSHLARMPVHELKIDQSFVRGLESDPEFATVVKSAIDMGHSLGLQVVAEGIETESSARQLAAMQCDIAQGYLYAKPMPRPEFERWTLHRDFVPVLATPTDLKASELSDTAAFAFL